MTKLIRPQIKNKTPSKSVSARAEELSGALADWLKCRQEKIQAQAKLLQSCKYDNDVNSYKAKGLLNYDNLTTQLVRSL